MKSLHIRFLLLPVLGFGLTFLNSCKSGETQNLIYKPIGYFETAYNPETGAPRQGMLIDSAKGRIRLKPEYTKGLYKLETFEYIWVIYYFDKAQGYDNLVRPPESDHSFGVFSTRSPRRPNPIGLSLVRLDSISGDFLYLSNVDAFDQTPVLDIKPFLPSVDYAVSIQNMEAELYLGHHSQDFLSDSLVKIFIEGYGRQNDNKSVKK